MNVDVAAVEKELTRIQRELTKSEVRTSLFNLVVFSRDAGKLMTDAALNELLGKRAARVIHIVSSEVPESSHEVSARCFVDKENKGVCFQEIVITNGGDGAGGAPGSWVPLLVRDIPTFVLWLDSICDKRELFAHAQEPADKLIIDTQRSLDLGDTEDELFEVVRDVALNESVPVVDFTFRRLHTIMRSIAVVFDDDRRTPWLEEITRIVASGLSSMSSRLLGLWFAQRLNWSGAGPVFKDRGRKVRLERVGDEDGQVRVTIEFTGHDAVTVAEDADGCVEIDCPDDTFPLFRSPGDGALLLDEVDSGVGDGLYRTLLSHID